MKIAITARVQAERGGIQRAVMVVAAIDARLEWVPLSAEDAGSIKPDSRPLSIEEMEFTDAEGRSLWQRNWVGAETK